MERCHRHWRDYEAWVRFVPEREGTRVTQAPGGTRKMGSEGNGDVMSCAGEGHGADIGAGRAAERGGRGVDG